MTQATSESSSPLTTATVKRWESISFTSTLYLRPILDALLEPTPNSLHDELRLGLQEALVNAAKHGNGLDPQKIVSVRHARSRGYYWWIVTDQGDGFERTAVCSCPDSGSSPEDMFVSECGRGLFILHQVFDRVLWSEDGKEIYLAKQIQATPFVVLSPAAFLRVVEGLWHRWAPVPIRGI